MTSILGLPAHPLFAHIPVVLIPLAAIGAVLMPWPRLRDKIGWAVVGIVFVAGICTQLAISSGQGLEDSVRETQLMRDHVEMGESIRPWVLLMFLALLGLMVVDHLARRRVSTAGSGTTGADARTEQRLRYAGTTLVVLSLVLSAVATVTIFRIGHSGSKAVWHPTQVKIDRGGGRSDGDSDEG
ncbi:MAG: DUF2231 domain-containing protein [Acidimicrobiia bacterium]|jgi:hypothetical protein